MLIHAATSIIATGLTDVLRKTYPIVWWWDVLRYVDAVLTAALILMYSRIAFGRNRPQSHEEIITIRVGILSYMAALVPSCLTEIASLGQPIVPWRLPLFMVMNVFGWWYVARRL